MEYRGFMIRSHLFMKTHTSVPEKRFSIRYLDTDVFFKTEKDARCFIDSIRGGGIWNR